MSRQFTWSFDIIGQTLGHRNCTPAVIERFFDLSSLRSSYHGGAREDSDKSSLPRKGRDDDACLAEEKSLPPQVATKLARQTTRFQLWNALPLFLPPPPPLVKNEENFSWSLSERTSARTGTRYKLLVDDLRTPSIETENSQELSRNTVHVLRVEGN